MRSAAAALKAESLGFRIFYALVNAAAVGITIATASNMTVTRQNWISFAALLGLGVMQSELGRSVERMRRMVSPTLHVNMLSVWTFGAVLVLPFPMVAALTIVLYLHFGRRSLYRMRSVPFHRVWGNAVGMIVTCSVAMEVMHAIGVPTLDAALTAGWMGVVAVIAALVTHFLTGSILVIPGLRIPLRKMKLRAVAGSADQNGLEVATLCLGSFTALALATMPALAFIIIPPLLILHRAVLVKQLEVLATTDQKTDTLNLTGWHVMANSELARAKRMENRPFGLLMVDLDFFKKINDTHGHLAGDAVLKAVAATIKEEVREYDSVGRFGGEEFVGLLPDITEPEVLSIAERVRVAITKLEVEFADGDTTVLITGLSASIGVATYPEAGSAIDALLRAADAALYTAKEGGRNRVVTALQVPEGAG